MFALPHLISEYNVTLLGVQIYADRAAEEAWIEVQPLHSPRALREVLAKADDLGLEVMSELECPPEDRPNGATRIYLAHVD